MSKALSWVAGGRRRADVRNTVRDTQIARCKR